MWKFCHQTHFFFRWLIQLLQKGYEKPLEAEDLGSNYFGDNCKSLHSTLLDNWNQILSKDPNGKRRPLLWATLKSFQFVIILCAVVRVFDTCLLLTLERIFLGQILQRLVKESPGEDEVQEGEADEFKVAVFGFIILSLFRLILGGVYYYILEGVGRKMRIGLTSLVYAKVLRLSQNAIKEVGAGGVINLVSNDGAKLENSYEILTVFIGPLQLCSLTWIVWTHFGASSGCGLVTIILLGLVQSYMGKIGSAFRAEVASASCHRVKLVTQIVTAIRTIKMYAWEVPFAKLVGNARRRELKLIRRSHMLRTIGWCLYSCTASLGMFFTIIAYLSTGNVLTAEKVFVCTTIYQNIGMVLNIDFPKGLAQLGIFLLTVSRFQDFLLLEEFQASEVPRVKSARKPGSISMKNVSVELSKNPVLTNVSLELGPSSELVAIVGSVGSGKSTFFNTILREIPLSSGKLEISGKIVYSPQQAWLFRGTIRENILFGNSYQPGHYEKVIHACALTQDLNSFPQGDETQVADGGVSLSGGQKARISLARAVYADADIYLLDDTLSAVDQQVGQHIVTYCINGILKNKLRLLVTHQVQLLPESTQILRIDGGSITPVTCDLHSILPLSFKDCDEDVEHESLRISNEKYFDDLNSNIPKVPKVPTIQSDRVPMNLYQKYFCAGPNSWRYLTVFIFCTLLAQTAQAGESYFLKFSVTETETDGFRSWSYSAQLASLLTVISLVVLTSTQQSSSFLRIIHFNSITIYNSMFETLLKAPVQFFTDHSTGYVIERFARDTFILDEVFPFTIFYASHILQQYVASLFLFIASSFNVLMVVPSVTLLYAVYLCQQFQIRSCRSLNRLELSARDSITSHLNSSVHGLTTIRAFGKENEMESRFRGFLDSYFWINWIKLSVISLTSATIDFLSRSVVNLFILITIFSSEGGSGFGYAIAPLITLTQAIGWATSQFHVIESQAKSVESILGIMQVESEGMNMKGTSTRVLDRVSPPADWPWKGKITFDNVSLTYYAAGRRVLKGVSFTIFPGEKIGIIGRTAAGKSSLVSALFRLSEFSGAILIDGINIQKIPLSDLRPRISIIPQDPVLFEGTVRSNLDPFGQFSDESLLTSLHNVSLVHFTDAAHEGLDMEIQEGGKNLSVGERQLICMARALLRKNKILILDEATANIDEETSAIIHEKMSQVFSDCTVLTIQHRLTSILDSDRVLVMDDGEIIEFDTPETLLKNPRSYLSQRVLQRTGHA